MYPANPLIRICLASSGGLGRSSQLARPGLSVYRFLRKGRRYDSVLFCEESTTIDKEFFEDAGPRGRVAAELHQVVLAGRGVLRDFSD